MREILFKAKRKDNGEWVEGFLFDDGMAEVKRYFIGRLVIVPYKGNCDDDWDIEGNDFYEINPDTISQFTGLCDKNGNRIWENDIVELVGTYSPFVCKWDEYIARFIFDNDFSSSDFNCYRNSEIEVIGNVFDNVDLLEVE